MFLVTGANGQLGNELRLVLKDKATYIDKEDLDITDAKAVTSYFEEHKFEWIINCAAYTAVDKAEDEPDLVRQINVEGPKNLALTGAPILHISTDYVFDGCNHLPYLETDVANPQSVYGQSKLDGENAVLENASTAVIIRTAWLYSKFGNNFVKTMQRLGADKEQLNVVFDQIGTPTCATDLVTAIVEVMAQTKPGSKEIYNFTNEGVCSWYDFALAIMKLSGLECQVNPIESVDYPTKAIRPFYSVLNKTKIKKHLGIKMKHWSESLAACVKSM